MDKYQDRERIAIVIRKDLWFFGMSVMLTFIAGCALKTEPVLHMVEYRSSASCTPRAQPCPWEKLEREAQFSATVNCLLSGANVIQSEQPGLRTGQKGEVLVPVAPAQGYRQVVQEGGKQGCSPEESACRVESRREWEATWVTCDPQPRSEEQLRGGETLSRADSITGNLVVTGTLSNATDDFSSPQGLDGPDHFYTFTLSEQTAIDAAVAANSSYWVPATGHQAPWQPGLHLLRADGTTVSQGQVWRAGVSSLFPTRLNKGVYFLVVDSSEQEFIRGDGVYRLYLGFKTHKGFPPSP